MVSNNPNHHLHLNVENPNKFRSQISSQFNHLNLFNQLFHPHHNPLPNQHLPAATIHLHSIVMAKGMAPIFEQNANQITSSVREDSPGPRNAPMDCFLIRTLPNANFLAHAAKMNNQGRKLNF
jgi:hypothetical protein